MKILYVIPSYNRRELLLSHISSLFVNRHNDEMRYTVFCYVQGASEEDLSIYMDAQNKYQQKGLSVVFKFVPKYNPFVCGKMRRDALLMAYKCCGEHDLVWWSDDDLTHTGQNPKMDQLIKKTFDNPEFMVVNLKVGRNTKDYLRFKKGFNPTSSLQFYPTVNMGILFRYLDLHQLISPDIEFIDSGEDLYPFIKSIVLGRSFAVINLDETTMKDVITAPGGAFEIWSEQYPDLPRDMTARNEYITNQRKSSVQTRFADFFHYDSAFANGKRMRNNLKEYISQNITLDNQYNIIRTNTKCMMPVDGTVRKTYGLHLRDYSHLDTSEVPQYQ